MYPYLEAKKQAVTQLKKAIGKGFVVAIDALETPPKPEMGDLSFPCFQIAKEMKRNPAEIASELAAKIGPTKFIATITAIGPYVNFTFNLETLGDAIFAEVKKKKPTYGQTQAGVGKKVLLEYAQPNTHKEFHIGHVRSSLLGQSIVNILRANGYEVIPTSYIGDIGAHVAKAIWGLKKFHDGEVFAPEIRAKKLGEIYTEATQYVEANPEAKAEIDLVQGKLENGDKEWRKIWLETREWCLTEFREIFEELQIKPEVYYYESDVEEAGKELVKTMLTSGIAKKSEGATIVDLEAEGLGAFLILKSDGSSLYATKDLALAYRKEKDFDPDRQLVVVDVRQSLYFKQLFATLKKMGFTAQLGHISFDLVTLPGGAMSSRKGNIVTFKDLRDDLVEVLVNETAGRHADWSAEKVAETAHKLALSALAFLMLRQDPKSIITFDRDEAAAFDGFTGPYIVYTYARLQRLLEKAPFKPAADATKLAAPQEKALIRQLALYPSIVQRAGADYSPALIAAWLFDTCKVFAEYYNEVRILDDAPEEVVQARLALVQALIYTLAEGMKLLCLQPVNEM